MTPVTYIIRNKIGPGTRRPFYKQNNKYLPHLGKNVKYVGTESGIIRQKVV